MEAVLQASPMDSVIVAGEDRTAPFPDLDAPSVVVPAAVGDLDTAMADLDEADGDLIHQTLNTDDTVMDDGEPTTVSIDRDGAVLPSKAAQEVHRADSVSGNDVGPQLPSNSYFENTFGDFALTHLDDTAFEDSEVQNRRLRPMRRYQTFTTWMDEDQTGDYDPAEEARLERSRRYRTKLGGRPHCRFACDTDSAAETPESGEVATLPVKLRFTTERAKSLFTQLLTENEKEARSDRKGYKLRKRAGDTNVSVPICEKLSDLDIRAKPFARGCYSCAVDYGSQSQERCSLLDDERSWPCDACTSQNKECELITPSMRKRACEPCKNRRVACSYTNTRNHSGSCKNCAKFMHPCIAGPVQAFIKPRIRQDRDWQIDPYPQAKKKKDGELVPPKACAECHQADQECSYIPDDDGHYRNACTKCLAEFLPCTISMHKHHTKPDSTHAKSSEVSQEPPPRPSNAEPETVLSASTGSADSIIKINTSFSHPITFNCDDDTQQTNATPIDNKPCHFCSEPALAFFGLGRLTTQVISHPDFSGYEEINNGHRSRGIENTRLCSICTLRRMCIVMCDKHAMRPMENAQFAQNSAEDTMDLLLSGELTPDNGEKFCSLCTNAATYDCAAETGEEEMVGCGLKLCEPCALALQGKHDGDLMRMLRCGEVDEEMNEVRPLGFRADCELLREEGTLMRYLKRIGM